jgi:CO/xanthine dehydrogenase Mo-binding subunit
VDAAPVWLTEAEHRTLAAVMDRLIPGDEWGPGAGEAGAIGSCPAVVNAIVEGLWREYKIDHIDMPATPERVWIAIREQHRRHSL